MKNFKATSDGGHVVVDKTNFLIALAPYFFPLYAVMVVAVFAVGHLVWNWKHYLVWFHLLVGAAYAFHVTLTAHVLKTRQSDITSQGYLFLRRGHFSRQRARAAHRHSAAHGQRWI